MPIFLCSDAPVHLRITSTLHSFILTFSIEVVTENIRLVCRSVLQQIPSN